MPHNLLCLDRAASPRQCLPCAAVIGLHSVREVICVHAVLDINPVAGGHRRLAIDLLCQTHPWIGISHLTGVRIQEGGQHDAPEAHTEIRRELILDIHPFHMWPVGVVIILLRYDLQDSRERWGEVGSDLPPRSGCQRLCSRHGCSPRRWALIRKR